MKTSTDNYLEAFNSPLVALRQWEDLDRFWEVLRGQRTDWYVYAVGEAPPQGVMPDEQLDTFITEINALLRRDHDEPYCGIVYVDDRAEPGFVKIYDPNNLGSSCGSSGVRVLPGWTLSKQRPQDLEDAFPPPANRRRWWQKLLRSA